MNTVFTLSYPLPAVDRREVRRYAGMTGRDAQVETLIDECVSKLPPITGRVCYTEIGTAELIHRSHDLGRCIADCRSLIVMAATVGVEPDRLIARYASISPSAALIYQAVGAERIECLCDVFEADLRSKGYETRPRFSPGYGDLPLDFQKNIFAILDCAKKIGLSLNESLSMSPSKSVTAIIGIKRKDPI